MTLSSVTAYFSNLNVTSWFAGFSTFSLAAMAIVASVLIVGAVVAVRRNIHAKNEATRKADAKADLQREFNEMKDALNLSDDPQEQSLRLLTYMDGLVEAASREGKRTSNEREFIMNLEKGTVVTEPVIMKWLVQFYNQSPVFFERLSQIYQKPYVAADVAREFITYSTILISTLEGDIQVVGFRDKVESMVEELREAFSAGFTDELDLRTKASHQRLLDRAAELLKEYSRDSIVNFDKSAGVDALAFNAEGFRRDAEQLLPKLNFAATTYPSEIKAYDLLSASFQNLPANPATNMTDAINAHRLLSTLADAKNFISRNGIEEKMESAVQAEAQRLAAEEAQKAQAAEAQRLAAKVAKGILDAGSREKGPTRRVVSIMEGVKAHREAHRAEKEALRLKPEEAARPEDAAAKTEASTSQPESATPSKAKIFWKGVFARFKRGGDRTTSAEDQLLATGKAGGQDREVSLGSSPGELQHQMPATSRMQGSEEHNVGHEVQENLNDGDDLVPLNPS